MSTPQLFLALTFLVITLPGCRSSSSASYTLLAGQTVSEELVKPINPPVYRSPSGVMIPEGTVDDGGWILPLDIRREDRDKKNRAFVGPGRTRVGPSVPAGPFSETRLGPDDSHTQNETSIAISGNTLVAGWNNFTDSGLVMGMARSGDGGATWSESLWGGFDVMSDPVVAAGGDQQWYFAFIATGGGSGTDFEVFVRRSTDDGVNWSAPVAVTSDSDFDDKPWIAARGDEVLAAWADFSFSPAKIRASRSLDGGQSFGLMTTLADNSVGGNGASTVIAADGTYYVFWRDSFQQFLWMAKSINQGTTWSTDTSIAAMDPLPSSLPGGFRVVNLPTAASNPVNGHLLVLWNDESLGDADILAIRSSDGGDTWSSPVRVNDDTSGFPQFFPWVTFDSLGVAHAIWYDRREDGSLLEAYYAYSEDSGATWSANHPITPLGFTPVLPPEGGAAAFIGDYNGITASSTWVYPFYQDARRGEQDVWVARLPRGLLFADGFESGDLERWSSTVIGLN